jgi:hypothetical protein
VVWISKSNRAALKRKARQRSRPFCIVFRLIAVALLNLPQAVILPRQYMVRIGFQRALVPDLREFGVAELTIGIADQIANVRVIVVAKCL